MTHETEVGRRGTFGGSSKYAARVRVRELVDRSELGLTVLTGHESLDRPIRWVYTTDLLDPGRYLTGGELVLTGMMWRRGPGDAEEFARAVAAADVAAVGAGDAVYGEIPDDLVAACREHRVTLFEVPIDVSFATITDSVTGRLTEESSRGVTEILNKRRRLLHAVTQGSGLDGLVRVWSGDNQVPCAVLSTAGRRLAAELDLDDADVDTLARRFLATDRVPCVVRLPDKRMVSMYPVGSRALTGWFLVCAGDHERWQREAQESVLELASLVGVERTRTEEGLRARERFGARIVQLVTSAGSDPAELSARLRAADLDPDAPFVAVVATQQGMTGPVDVPAALLDDVLRPSFPELTVATPHDETIALVPVASAERGSEVATLVRGAVDRLAPVMGRRRLAVGISHPAPTSAALRGAVDEARHVCRLAELRQTGVSVATADDVDSHVLLVASVPDDIREAFRSRVLGPVLRYDGEHNTSLVATLRAYLESPGAWQRCADHLHIHVNTLRYRIKRVEELTGRSLANQEDVVDLYIALRIS